MLGREVEFGQQFRTMPIHVCIGCVVDEMEKADCNTRSSGFEASVRSQADGFTEQQVVQPFLQALQIPIVAPSLGGPDTLVIQPSRTSHAEVPAEERKKRGITDTLIRVSTGLENTDDLLRDFAQALDAVAKHTTKQS